MTEKVERFGTREGRWVDFYYDDKGNRVKSVTSSGLITHLQYDENGRLIYIESSDKDTVICSKEHFDITRKPTETQTND